MGQATFFKTFTESDKTSTRTLLHESIPITGTIVSGSQNPSADNRGYRWLNDTTKRSRSVKTFSHGMFQSVYDYPYLSSSANQIFDLTYGISNAAVTASSYLHAADENWAQKSKKLNIYTQMAQMLVGYDVEGNVRRFDADGVFGSTHSRKIDDAIFINFSRLLVKDEIKKGSFELTLGMGTGSATYNVSKVTLKDTNAENRYSINSPAGEYAVLWADNVGDDDSKFVLNKRAFGPMDSSGVPIVMSGDGAVSPDTGLLPAGLIYYQAGIAVINGALFSGSFNEGPAPAEFGPVRRGLLSGSHEININDANISSVAQTAPAGGRLGRSDSQSTIAPSFTAMTTGSSIDKICDAFRSRMINVSFNNTTELNSRIYFCRGHHNEFNYSSNPTYTDGSKIRVKNDNVLTPPRSYITTVGLYSGDNELLAVAKLSEPIRKDPGSEITLRVRLDY